MELIIVAVVAFIASGLTFFSGFGLGTLLLPAFAWFFQVEQAVALTGVVHFLNGLFKLGLVGRHADRPVLVRFGVPAVAAALLGAWLLVQLAQLPPLMTHTWLGRPAAITPVKLIVGSLLLVFAVLEASKRFRAWTLPPRWLPLGGALSGFFGGLSGMQGALRSAFLLRAGLSKQAFIGTGVVLAVLIDVSRLSVYAGDLAERLDRSMLPWLSVSVGAAFAGAWLGNRFLQKLTLDGLQRIVGGLLLVTGLALMLGLI